FDITVESRQRHWTLEGNLIAETTFVGPQRSDLAAAIAPARPDAAPAAIPSAEDFLAPSRRCRRETRPHWCSRKRRCAWLRSRTSSNRPGNTPRSALRGYRRTRAPRPAASNSPSPRPAGHILYRATRYCPGYFAADGRATRCPQAGSQALADAAARR